MDIGYGIVVNEYQSDINEFLELKNNDSNLFDEMCICGYPSGKYTLDIEKKYTGLRFSPIVQVGKITLFLPSDDVSIPYGIQTDIITGGGSSGSPIVDLNDGEVVGTTQEILLNKSSINLTGKKQVYFYFVTATVQD
jgi:hypothetical protein